MALSVWQSKEHSFTCNKDSRPKCDAKCIKWGCLGTVRGHSRSLEMTPFDRLHTSCQPSILTILLLFCFLHVARYWSKLPFFDSTVGLHVCGTGVWVWLVEFHQVFSVRILESLSYHAALIEWRSIQLFKHNTSVWQTDRQTDGQTELLHQCRALHMLCYAR